MLPNKVLFVGPNHAQSGEGIVVSTKPGSSDAIVLQATTVPTSLALGEQTHYFTIHPDKPGVVFVTVRLTDRHGKFLIWVGLPLGVFQDSEGKFYVKDYELWIAPDGRIGQCSAEGVYVIIDGEVYKDWSHGKGYHVADSNLLCRYLTGDATPDQVKAAAVKQKEGESVEAAFKILMPLLGEPGDKIPMPPPDELGENMSLQARAMKFVNQYKTEQQEAFRALEAFERIREVLGTSMNFGMLFTEILPPAVEELKHKYESVARVWQLLVDLGLAEPLEKLTEESAEQTVRNLLNSLEFVYFADRIARQRLGTPVRHYLRSHLEILRGAGVDVESLIEGHYRRTGFVKK